MSQSENLSTRLSQKTVPAHPIRTGEIIGWRVWCAIRERPGAHSHLQSIHFLTRWPTLVPLEARNFQPANPYSLGGIHAFATYGMARNYLPWCASHNDTFIIGQVALWGTVVTHDAGYRAEFAYPLAFSKIFGEGFFEGRRTLSDLRQGYALPTMFKPQ